MFSIDHVESNSFNPDKYKSENKPKKPIQNRKSENQTLSEREITSNSLLSPRHAPPVRIARSIVGICERNQTKPRQRPLLKINPKRTRPNCIPQYTTRRFPVDQLRRTAIPCYCPHCIRDIRPGQKGNPQKRTDQLSKRKQNIRLVNIKIPKPPSCRNRNTVASFHTILLSQFFRVRLLRNSQPPCLPVSLVIAPRVPLELAQRLDWNETSEILTELITPFLLSHGKNIINMHH